MQASLWVRYLFGQGSAIRQVAESRSALWTGICLVLLTAFARSYDQTFIGEKPVHWFFGPLLFSLVSGTWLYVCVYGVFARSRMKEAKPAFWSGWRTFMGLFWMTAPIAWLYAIPVERWFDPVTAAKANVLLLSVVSLWRVLLVARVIQHLISAPLYLAMFWVLLGATVEILVVFFFGGGFAQSIMRGMGGMRNSPAEEVVFRAMGNAFGLAFFTAPVVLILSSLPWKCSLKPFPAGSVTPMRWTALVVAAVFWVGVSIVPQIQLSRNFTVEKSLEEGNARAALDYLSAHRPDQFAPARTLPPKPYEWTVFEQLPDCFDAVQPSDDPWVREFLVERLDEMMVHYGSRWRRTLTPQSRDEQIAQISQGLQWHGPEPNRLLKMINGLARIPEGQAWLKTNSLFLYAAQQAAVEGSVSKYSKSAEQAGWLSLSNRLRDFVPIDFSKSSTNGVGNAPPIQR